MDFDMLTKMRVDELKIFLRLRGLKVSGRKEELVARAFAAIENNVQPVKTAEEVEVEIRTEYTRKLVIGDEVLPDPFFMKDWIVEDIGVTFWPMILYPDIFNYLSFNPSELGSKDLSDYKSCKAYSYYKCGWLQPLQYHPVSDDSKFCILKAQCRKSEKINDPFHKLWVVVSKKDAKIHTAHCTCMAGLSMTCNHVAAALFRIEAAVRLGLTNPACTSAASQWLPNRQEVEPSKLKNISFDRDDFAQRGKKKQPLVATPKKRFDPLAGSNMKLLSLVDFAKAIKDISPDSILLSAVPKPEIDFVREDASTKAVATVPSIQDLTLMSKTKTEFIDNIKITMTAKNISEIEVTTRGQSKNDAWFDYRKGVITASKAHEVLTKMEKVKKSGAVNMWTLNQNISGFTFVNPDLPALKYGRTMEENAVNCFIDIAKKDHRNLKVDSCGLFLYHDRPYIGGSPDGIVICDCCQQSCLEIKCPFSINFTTPYDPAIYSKLPYLVKSEKDKLTINKRHKYYTQCQVQMGVTGIKKSYFMVWTPHGYVLDTLYFDPKLWESMTETFYMYYNNFYLKGLFYSSDE
jgi:hypothetical protein